MDTHYNWSIPERIEFVQDGKVGVRQLENGRGQSKSEHNLKQFKASSQLSETTSKSGYNGSWITPCSSVSLEWKKVFRTGKGLRNLGNTCFLNASLQSLLHCPPFATALLEKVFSTVSNCKCHSGYCSICVMEKIANNIFSADASSQSYSPVELVRNLKILSKTFTPGRQADAHEFIRFLLDDMNRTLLGLPRGKLCNDRQREMNTLIHQVFGGCYESKVLCQNCGSSSDTVEPFLDVSLDLEGVSSVDKALKAFITPERLFGRNRYFCSNCKQKTDASKVFQFRRIPNVFIFHLKRFRFTKKENKFVSFDEMLDFSSSIPLKDSNIRSPIYYRLCAVVVHEGFSIHGGHYYAYVRNSNGIWYLKDDECTRQVGVQTVLQQKAYLLFYCRVEKRTQNSTVPLKTTKNGSKDSLSCELQQFSKPHSAMERHESVMKPEMDNTQLSNGQQSVKDAIQTYEMSLLAFLRLQLKIRRLQGLMGLDVRHLWNTSFQAQMRRKLFAPSDVASASQGDDSVQRQEKRSLVINSKQQDSKQTVESMPSPFSVGFWNNCSSLIDSRNKLLSGAENQPSFIKKRDIWDVEYDKGKQRKRRKKRNAVQNFAKYATQLTSNSRHLSSV